MCKTACGHPSRKAWGLLGLRIAVGVIFIYMGYGKLGAGHTMASGMFASIGLPGSGSFWAYVIGLFEFVGGLMVLLGIFASTAAMWLSVILIVAMLTIHRGGPFPGYFLPLAVLGGCLALIGSGAGALRLVKMECPCPKCKDACQTGGGAGALAAGGTGGCCGGSCGGNCENKKDQTIK